MGRALHSVIYQREKLPGNRICDALDCGEPAAGQCILRNRAPKGVQHVKEKIGKVDAIHTRLSGGIIP